MSEKKSITNKEKQEFAKKNMRFNRFLIFRYMTALFFFVNLYWAILSLSKWTFAGLIPIGLLIINGLILIEQTQKYWQQSNQLIVTIIGYWIQTFVNALGIILVLFNQQAFFVPFMRQSGRILLLLLFTIGLLACLYIQRKAWLIEHDRDSYLKYLEIFENKGGKTNELRK
ncbi:hypothetical protein [Carnobacterium sp.]|uniref:hypothetical protein n=1 Tax=Carnobacterium sp. TaxID=48221 RepID=UPI0028AF332A|nr:hypothetical protein [Carnobacterium sp.]